MTRTRCFSVPKAGRAEAENEDAFEIDVGQGIAAVADGATDSSFSKAWARLLVDGFRLWPLDPASPPDALVQWLERPQAMWRSMLEGRPLPWHAQHKVARGAFAALVAADIRPNGSSVSWSALGVGDSCLFVVEDDRLTVSFPIEDPEEFGSTPFLIGTSPDANAALPANLKHRQGHSAPGALFLFMSDALAHWFLAQAKAGERPWHLLLGLDDAAAFQQLVDNLREMKALRNDDSTLVIWET